MTLRQIFFSLTLSISLTGVLAGPTLAAEKKNSKTKSNFDTVVTVNPKEPEKKKKVKADPLSAKNLFGYVLGPADIKARSIGSYTRGCLAGAKMLAVDGEAWQAMRLSRNRNWGHPKLISYVEHLAVSAKKAGEWPGLLVGDLSQPRGGPMLTGHKSHQLGLDADIWLTPMPNRRLSRKEREELSATSMLGPSKLSVSKSRWTNDHAKLLKRAASYKQVARIFVHPAIKKKLCETKDQGDDRNWLYKIRPWFGHHYHFHVRLKCQDPKLCKGQKPVAANDGCDKELKYWFKRLTTRPKPKPRCIAGRLTKKVEKIDGEDKKKAKTKITWECTCGKGLKRVAMGKKGSAKCVNPDGSLPRFKKYVRGLNWLPRACAGVIKHAAPPLYAARKMDESIPLPERK